MKTYHSDKLGRVTIPDTQADLARLREENRELREALKGLVALDFFPHGDDPGECMSMCPVCQALDNAHAALASGEGEKP